MTTEAIANKILSDIWDDLSDRGGFDGWWNNVDEETQNETKETLIKIILKNLK